MDDPSIRRSFRYTPSYLLGRLHHHLERFLLRILSHGPIPQHVAFVMDGNRRYARMKGLKVEGGHGEGFESLKRTLELCFHLSIPTITVYAFSIDNFKRPAQEVDEIMRLAKENLVRLGGEGELLHRHSVKVNVLGRRELLPEDVREAIERLENMTRDNERATLNVCCPYTSRDEITTAVNDVLVEHADSSSDRHPSILKIRQHSPDFTSDTPSLSPSSSSSASSDSSPPEIAYPHSHSSETHGRPMNERITDFEIFDKLSTSEAGAPPLDILVRTSDVRRLSDFMLLQCNKDTQLQFVKTFWPEFGIKDMLPILLQYQQKIWMSRVGGLY